MRQYFLTAGLLLPLALDTFALAAALGLAGLKRDERLRVALVFTAFEAGMPVVGVLIGRAAGSLVGGWAEYGAIGLLLLAGFLILRSGEDEGDGETARLSLLARARGPAVLSLGLSVSIDELTVGLGAGLLGLSVAVTVTWITLQAFIAAQLGLALGTRLSERLRERAEQVAGAALIGLALVLAALRLLGLGV